MKNCVDIIKPFSEQIAFRDNIQVIGGIGSAALTNSKVEIFPNERWIIAPDNLALPQRRDDGNLRDFDALVLSADRSVIDEAEHLARQTIGDDLELSFFGLKPEAYLDEQVRHPARSSVQVLSDRYVRQAENGEITSAMKSLFPFEVPMHPETLETWSLFIGNYDFYPTPVPHPGTTILNYLTRSISGLRPKDAPKVNEIVNNVLSKAPEIRDWLMDGPGQDQMELARIFQTLRGGGSLVVGNTVNIQPVKDKLSDHPAFMMPDASEAAKAGLVGTARTKSRLLHTVESNQRVVTLWQKFAEKRAGKIIHNQ